MFSLFLPLSNKTHPLPFPDLTVVNSVFSRTTSFQVPTLTYPSRLTFSVTGRLAVKKGSHRQHIQKKPRRHRRQSLGQDATAFHAFASSHRHDSTTDSHCDCNFFKIISGLSTGTAEGATVTNGSRGELLAADEDVPNYQSVAEKQKKIQELTAELEVTNQRCEVYRANLLAVLKDMEEQKLKLSVKVQNARLSLKE
ncbi:FAR1-RELATED SEQUENCE 9 [Spatholobus suberectus]|nr:FAR1-RELATED SEQUENCE 9 [Spatholobus suberectus]